MKKRSSMINPPRARAAAYFAALLLSLLAGAAHTATAQKKISGYDIERGRSMLGTIKSELEKNYYDPTFKGLDVQALFKQADEMIKGAQSNGQIFGIIAHVLIQLDDSHTFFMPPGRVTRVDYGWEMQMVGDKCYVVALKPGSDAAAKGLKEGDEVISLDGMTPIRQDFWKLGYLYRTLRPVPGLRLVARSPGGQPRELEILTKLSEGKKVTDLTDYNEYMRLVVREERDARLRRHRYYELGEELFIWKMPQFDLPKEKVDDMAGKLRKFKSVILDLRGNGGGAEETLLRMIGNFVERDVKIGDLRRRKEIRPLVAKSVGKDAYQGKLIVLLDSESGSSSELFARVMQMESRATVIGDRSMGAVMRGRHYGHQFGIDTVSFYGVSITDADLLMSDGKGLEGAGVTPDELLLPTPADMAARRDPVLARAASLAGVELTPEKAGTLFPVEWRKN
ncbi:MAG TPA: S41 family peptidase [Pyrinomonadaceae bacterium]|nr:S41 family peptidase [Pyrinomonadaceae bacterium]